MLEQIKVLNGILALDEFTVASLADFSGVKLPTAYTVLHRRRELLDPVGVDSTGRPGGQIIRYRLKPGAVARLRSEIGDAAAAISLNNRQATPEEKAPESLNLEAAEEFLERRISQTENVAEKRLVLETANVYLEEARREFGTQFGDSKSAFAKERAGRLTALITLRDNIAANLAPVTEEIIPSAVEIQEDIAEAVPRMALLDVLTALVSEAKKTSDPAERETYLAEARRAVDSCRSVLARRKALAPEEPVASLELTLQVVEDRILRLESAANRVSESDKATILKLLIEARAAELMRRAESEAGANSDRWLSALAELETTPTGGDAEVGFFGGYLVARGRMGRAQDTFLDKWLRSIAFNRANRVRRKAEPSAPSWPALQEKFDLAVGQMIQYGAGRENWNPLFENCLDGLANTAPLAVVPSIHKRVGQLAEITWSGLRRSCQRFLQQYSLSAGIVRHIAAANAADHTVDAYFASDFDSFGSRGSIDAGPKRARTGTKVSNDELINADLVAAFRMRFGDETDTAQP